MHKITKYLLVLLAAGYLQPTNAQDTKQGEMLYKQCFTCHTLGKKSTGPDLVGARAKWNDAGEGAQLIEWVKNPEAMIAGGKSTMANAIKDFSPTMMPAHTMSTEEITSIFDYIDAWVPPAPVVKPPEGGDVAAPVTVYVPDYQQNLTVFYWLCFTTLVLIMAIFLLSGSTQSLIKSDFFKERLAKLKDNSTPILVFVLSVGSLLLGSQAMALTFNEPGMAQNGDPWLLIEKSDIYTLAIIDLVLLGVVFYLRNVFNQVMGIVYTKAPAKVKVKKVRAVTKLNRVLTDIVPIEDEASILMDHEYDGIQELDNNLPPWWVWGFYATIVFSVIYILNFHVFKTSELQIDAYERDMVEKTKEVNDYLIKMAMNVDEHTATLLTDAKELDQGKVLFETNCVACHLNDGSGKIGPNLTDNAWVYGYDVKDLFKTVKYGTSNGMPEHASKLKPTQIQQVCSYILSLPEKPGKAPEGTIFEK